MRMYGNATAIILMYPYQHNIHPKSQLTPTESQLHSLCSLAACQISGGVKPQQTKESVLFLETQ